MTIDRFSFSRHCERTYGSRGNPWPQKREKTQKTLNCQGASRLAMTTFSPFLKPNGTPAYAGVTVKVETVLSNKNTVMPAQAGIPFSFFPSPFLLTA